ncbi:mucin-2-like [Liolophura sinensis]|uniref:mucin-2-like n=1 Tax=Liolophura sinensis TaxID=3198878 RepID=UPI00315897D4
MSATPSGSYSAKKDPWVRAKTEQRVHSLYTDTGTTTDYASHRPPATSPTAAAAAGTERGQRTLADRDSVDTALHALYYDPDSPAAYSGDQSLLKTARQHGLKVSRARVSVWLAQKDTYTLHRPARRRYPRNGVVVGGIDSQVDLVDMAAFTIHPAINLECRPQTSNVFNISVKRSSVGPGPPPPPPPPSPPPSSPSSPSDIERGLDSTVQDEDLTSPPRHPPAALTAEQDPFTDQAITPRLKLTGLPSSSQLRQGHRPSLSNNTSVPVTVSTPVHSSPNTAQRGSSSSGSSSPPTSPSPPAVMAAVTAAASRSITLPHLYDQPN